MKQTTIKIIEKKFTEDIFEIERELYKNKYEINKLAAKQKELKVSRSGMHEILRLIKGK